MADFRTPLRRARGMGAAKSGSHHFVAQRFTALAMLPLFVWLLFTLAYFATGEISLERAREFVGNPIVAALIISLVIAVFYHSSLGIQMVLEDYLHHHYLRLALQVLFNFACFIAVVVSIIAVVKIVVIV